jgi:site-specific DNA-methyltransferase (adenine-specific)
MNNIIQGDCLQVLKTLPDESVNCVVTSPPYWALRDYGTAKWIGGDPDCDHKAAKEKSRYDYHVESKKQVVKDGKSGTDAPRYKDVCPTCGAQKKDAQLGLESTFQEYINKLCGIFDEVKRVLREDGTCWVNLGDTYTSKCLLQIPSRFAIQMTDRGWILRNEIIWYKPNCMPASVKDRFTVDFEKVFFFVKNKKYWFETQYENCKFMEVWSRKGGTSSDSPYNKNNPRRCGLTKIEIAQNRKGASYQDPLHTKPINEQGRNKRCVWKVNTKPYKEAHFATFPETLVEPMIKAGCPVGGTVLDPFCGAGTTGLVAKKQNKNFIGIELNPEYVEIAKKRIDAITVQLDLFFKKNEVVNDLS